MSETTLYGAASVCSAVPMTRGEYNAYRGWSMPPDEQPDEPGYLRSLAEDPSYATWTPKHIFDKSFKSLSDGVSYGVAVDLLLSQKGTEIRHTSWHPQEFVMLVDSSKIQSAMGYGFGEYIGEPAFLGSLCKHTSNNELILGWTPTYLEMIKGAWIVRTKFEIEIKITQIQNKCTT